MSGQFVAMSEFLWRGYNVAMPAVDVGEDIFVVEAGDGVLRRVQVKTAGTGRQKNGVKTVQFTLSRSQLNLPLGGSELFFMLLARWDDLEGGRPWRFILMRRDELNSLRTTPAPGTRGRRRAPDAKAGDALAMKVQLSATDATAWGHSLAAYLDTWTSDWPVAGPMKARVQGGVTLAAARGPSPPAAARPRAPTSGPGTRRS